MTYFNFTRPRQIHNEFFKYKNTDDFILKNPSKLKDFKLYLFICIYCHLIFSIISEEIYKDWLRLRYEYLALTQETKRFLKSLRQDYLLAIITNGPTNAQWEKVNKLKLKPFFDLILVSGDLPWEKPDKQIFLEACDILGVEPQQCVMIGDKLETDILGGIISKLGGTVWVPFNGNKLKHSDPVPDYIVQNILTIHTILPQIKSDIEARNNKTFVLNQEDLLTDIEDGNSNGSDGS